MSKKTEYYGLAWGETIVPFDKTGNPYVFRIHPNGKVDFLHANGKVQDADYTAKQVREMHHRSWAKMAGNPFGPAKPKSKPLRGAGGRFVAKAFEPGAYYEYDSAKWHGSGKYVVKVTGSGDINSFAGEIVQSENPNQPVGKKDNLFAKSHFFRVIPKKVVAIQYIPAKLNS